MNFISHYYFDRHVADNLFAVGVSSPDLLSIFLRSVRIKDAHVKAMSARTDLSPEQQSFLKGVIRHFDGDKVFHSSEFFFNETHLLAVMLRERFGKFSVPRSFFVSHIMLELIIDKVLIQRDPSILGDYYSNFEQHSPSEIAKLTEWIADAPLPNYADFIEKFMERKFLYRYTDWGYVTYVLKRILQRVGVEEMGYLESADFLEVMNTYEAHLESMYLPRLAELGERLHGM
jgi:hypothetical protein